MKNKKIVIGISALVLIIVVALAAIVLPDLLKTEEDKRKEDLANAAEIAEVIGKQVKEDMENGETYFAGEADGFQYEDSMRYGFSAKDLEKGSILAEVYGSVPEVEMDSKYHFQAESVLGMIRVLITDGENTYVVHPEVAKISLTTGEDSPWFAEE